MAQKSLETPRFGGVYDLPSAEAGKDVFTLTKSYVEHDLSTLTFAAIWDPSEGMVLFSGRCLLDLLGGTNDSGAGTLDTQTLKHEMPPRYPIMDFPHQSLADINGYLHTYLQPLIKTPTGHYQRHHHKPSSTYGGVDVYLPQSKVGPPETQAHQIQQYSCLNLLDKDLEFNPMTAFDNLEGGMDEAEVALQRRYRMHARDSFMDEGFCEQDEDEKLSGVEYLNLVSHFSVTTTSTSNYVDLNFDDSDSVFDPSSWSTLVSSSPSQSPGRRLRKRRIPSADVSEYVSARGKGILRLARKLSNISRCSKNTDGEEWILIDVREQITQKVLRRAV